MNAIPISHWMRMTKAYIHKHERISDAIENKEIDI